MLFIITFIYVIHNEKSNLISREVRRKVKDLEHREGRKLHNHEIHHQIRELKIKLGNWCFVHQLVFCASTGVLWINWCFVHQLVFCAWTLNISESAYFRSCTVSKKITVLRPMGRESHWSILSLFSSSCYDFLCSLLPYITLQSYSNSIHSHIFRLNLWQEL